MKNFLWRVIQTRMKRWTRSGLNEFIKESLVPVKDQRILVVGGYGPILELIKSALPNQIIETLDIQRSHLPDYCIDISSPKISDLVSMKFDKIFCIEVLEHVPDYKRAICNLHQLLKDDGILIGSTPWIIPLHDQPYDFHRFTYFEIERIFLENHFRRVSIECRGNYIDSIFALGIRGLLSPHLSGKIVSLISVFLTFFLPKPKRYKVSQYSTIGYSFRAYKY